MLRIVRLLRRPASVVPPHVAVHRAASGTAALRPRAGAWPKWAAPTAMTAAAVAAAAAFAASAAAWTHTPDVACERAPNNRIPNNRAGPPNMALYSAVLDGDLARLSTLKVSKDPVDVNVRSPFGWCPIHVAAMTANVEMAKLLIEMGADVNVTDEHDQHRISVTDYFAELQQNMPKNIRPFFERRDFRMLPTMGFTPLHYAVLTGNEGIVKLLVENGANPSAVDRMGHVPLDNASGHVQNRLEPLIDSARAAYLENKEQLEKELRLKYPLESVLQQRIVGQLGPIQAVSAAIRRRQNGWQDTEHPLVFLFLGSSGIGKTELGKQLAAHLHPKNPDGFIRIDMSEYQQQHEVAKFIGSPPGYVGHEAGGQLTERLRKCPSAVVLLDEVEKAHPDVLTIMLQLFDEGRLTDGKGETIICKDAIFIMTSNLAQREIGDEGQSLRNAAKQKSGLTDKPTDEAAELSKTFIDDVVFPILRRNFRRDEFIGRINEVLFFLPFDNEELLSIARKELEFWNRQAAERHKIALSWDDKVLEVVIQGYNMRYGARWVKHEVERRIINQVAKAHEIDQVNAGGKVHVHVDDNGKIAISCTKGPPPTEAAKRRGWLI